MWRIALCELLQQLSSNGLLVLRKSQNFAECIFERFDHMANVLPPTGNRYHRGPL